MGLVDPCSYLFVMVARRLKSHNWPAAILLQQLRGAMKNFGGGGGGGVWIEHAAVQELPKSLSLLIVIYLELIEIDGALTNHFAQLKLAIRKLLLPSSPGSNQPKQGVAALTPDTRCALLATSRLKQFVDRLNLLSCLRRYGV